MQVPRETDYEQFVAHLKKNDEATCYRSARRLQAAWRGWVLRSDLHDDDDDDDDPFACDRCGEHVGQRRHSPNVCLCAGCRLDYTVEATVGALVGALAGVCNSFEPIDYWS